MSKFANNSGHRRSGQALIEFAVVAFVTTILFAAILSFGLLIFGANVLQQAVDVGAQEFARMPLSPSVEFPDLGTEHHSSTDPTGSTANGGTNVFSEVTFRTQIFDERYLVIDLDAIAPENVDRYLSDKPLINRLLRPLMIYEEVIDNGTLRRLVRYPGALVRNTNTAELTVLIPRITERDLVPGESVVAEVTGRETGIEWLAVIEEIREAVDHDMDLMTPPVMVGPLSLSPLHTLTAIDPGMVALRINYPFQSGAMVFYPSHFGEGAINHPATAIDNPGFDPPTPYELVVEADAVLGGNSRTSSGRFGLGHLEAYTKRVRPYRKLISTQAIYRREVFE